MRGLTPTLLAAQKAASGAPFVRAVATSKVRDSIHLDLAQTYSSFNADDEHDAEADADYFHRLRVRGGRVQYERGIAESWTDISSDTSADVAAMAAVNDERVIIVYNRGSAIYYRESTDQGGSWGTETLIENIAVEPNAVAVAYKNTSGDLAAFWEESGTVKAERRTSGTWASPMSWSKSANSVTGMDAVYTNAYRLVLTGTDTDDRPTIWTVSLHGTTDTWSQFYIVNQAESDEQITFQAPFLHFPDVYRLTYVEKFSGTPSYTRTFWTATVPGVLFTGGDWEWLDPVPMENTSNHGYAVASGVTSPATVFFAKPDEVLEAALDTQELDMSADLLEATIAEDDGLRQRGELVFDNANGQYAGPPAPIAIDRDMELGLGYGGEHAPLPGQSIIGWEYRREGGLSRFVVFTRGADYWLARSRPRTTIQYDSIVLNEIVRGAAARAGVRVINLQPSLRAQNFSLSWSIHPHQTSLSALEAVLELLHDIYLGAAPTFYIGVTEPEASDPIDYTYGTDHAIYGSRTRDEGAVNFAEILGDGVVGQAFDFPLMNENKPLTDRRRDPHSTVAADANEHAAVRLRRSQLEKDLGELVTPPNCGLEIGDVVGYSDGLVSGAQLKARVRSIETRFRRGASAVYEQRVSLGGL